MQPHTRTWLLWALPPVLPSPGGEEASVRVRVMVSITGMVQFLQLVLGYGVVFGL